jgi:hypothetical protein
MTESITPMEQLADDVGSARTVIEYSSDRRKRALARGCAAALAGGESVAKAEAEARASESYGKELEVLQKQHEAAEQTILRWEVNKLAWSTAQSLLSFQKETVRHL